jgi:hypothetical protein
VVEARRAIEQGAISNLQELTRAYMRVRDRVAAEVARQLVLRDAAAQFIADPQSALQALSQGLSFLYSQEGMSPERKRELLQNLAQLEGIVRIFGQSTQSQLSLPTPPEGGEGPGDSNP